MARGGQELAVAGSGCSRQLLPPSAFTLEDQRGSVLCKSIPVPTDAQLGKGLVNKSSSRPPWAHHGAEKPRDILHIQGLALQPLGGTVGVPWPRGWGFPEETSANAAVNTAGKERKVVPKCGRRG